MRALLILGLLFPLAAVAQDPPACNTQREGMTACFGEKLCACRYDQGGQLTGRPSGFRWDCGAFRPSCGTVPADMNPPQTQLPPGMFLNVTPPVPPRGDMLPQPGADLPPIAGPRRGY